MDYRSIKPKFTPFQKSHKFKKAIKIKSNPILKYQLKYGDVGLIATQSAKITAQQLVATRRTLTYHLNRKGKLWFRAFPDIPVSRKPIDARMGKGKGNISH